MVDGGFAVVEHSALVGAPVSGINGHGNWAVVDLSGQTTAATEALLAGDLESSTFSLAGLVRSSIAVGTLSGDSLSLHVLEGI